MSDRPPKRLWLLAASTLTATAYGVWWFIAPAADPFPPPPFSESAFLNVDPDARHVGTAACAGCHEGRHESYLRTAHSRALGELDPASEPPDAEYEHRASGRTYRVYRKDGQLRHAEIVRNAEGEEVAKVDVPIRYVIGSGSYSRSYLAEIDGFLHESPITWYTSKQRWDMSPGYDAATHWGFERPVNESCLFCHAGRFEAVGGTVHRMTFTEQAIGCESCHGPGSVHVEWHRAKKPRQGADDLTIVNPGKLPRPLLEAVCAACHLSGAAMVPVRGRQLTDFRPGRPLSDYRIDYRCETGGERMTVTGHVEQLRLSACYQKSPTLTCLSCHNPHAREGPKDVAAAQRQMCVACHRPAACGLAEPARRTKEPADNCVVCHMPRGDTDIPHIAFTHHRIGRHGKAPPPLSDETPDLVPVEDAAHLPGLDRNRNLGLAYLAVARHGEFARFEKSFHLQAQQLLEGVHKAGLREVETAVGLAELWWKWDRARAAAYAREALAVKDAPAEARAVALNILADCAMKDRDFAGAADLLDQLVGLRRFSEDWRLLGVCRLELDQPRAALAALRQAQAIRPTRPDLHSALTDAYRKLGEPGRADEHRQKAQWLLRHRQQ